VSFPAAVSRPRNPQSSDYYRCVRDYFETFVSIYDDHFSRQYGLWRPYLEKVIYRYLDCGDPHNGFARVSLKRFPIEGLYPRRMLYCVFNAVIVTVYYILWNNILDAK
jgi:hypothetical protein